jgi:hypothetical protein
MSVKQYSSNINNYYEYIEWWLSILGFTVIKCL